MIQYSERSAEDRITYATVCRGYVDNARGLCNQEYASFNAQFIARGVLFMSYLLLALPEVPLDAKLRNYLRRLLGV